MNKIILVCIDKKYISTPQLEPERYISISTERVKAIPKKGETFSLEELSHMKYVCLKTVGKDDISFEKVEDHDAVVYAYLSLKEKL
jgi:hypothetical protein